MGVPRILARTTVRTTFSTTATTAARIVGAVLGGYALSAALVMLLAVLLARAGMPRSDAVVAAAMAACLVYLGVLLWAFSVRSTGRLWLVVVAGTALACAATWMLRL